MNEKTHRCIALKKTICFLKKQSLLSFIVLTSLIFSSQPYATELEEIIVTAQYREKGLQDVPISISAVTGDIIEQQGIIKIENLTSVAPNFTYTETGIGTLFFIRGLGSGINQSFEQPVGLYIDGTHLPRAQQSRSPFLDLERIELLRGPQSILFGKNSIAGAINITTAKPSKEFEGSIFASHEFEDTETIVEGVLNIPLSERVRTRFSVRDRQADGYIENIFLDRKEPNKDEQTIRLQLAADLSNHLNANLKYEHSSFDTVGRNIEIEKAQPSIFPIFRGANYGQILTLLGQDASNLNQKQDGKRSSAGDFSNNQIDIFQLNLNWQSDGFSLKSTTSYQDFGYDELCDCEYVSAFIYTASLQESYKQFSQELRLTSPENEKYDYILGSFYQDSEHVFDDQINVSNNSVLIPLINLSAPGLGGALSDTRATRSAGTNSEILSAFTQFNYHFTDKLKLQLGARLSHEEKSGFRSLSIQTINGNSLRGAQAIFAPIVYAGVFDIASINLNALGPTGQVLLAQLGAASVTGERDETRFSPDIKLVWEYNNASSIYLSWGQGFKSGGFDFRANNKGASPTQADAFEFEDEEANNFELGGKFKIGSSAELNPTLFYTKFDDLQISLFDGTLGFNVGNAAGAEVYGLELDGRWALSDNWLLSGGLALTEFEFTDYRNGQCYAGRTPDVNDQFCDFTGATNNLVADFSGNLRLDYNQAFANGNYEFHGALTVFFTDDYLSANTLDPASQQDAYETIDIRLAVGPTHGSWELAFLAKNLTDKKVRTFSGDAPLAFSSFGAKTSYTFFTQGSTYTLQAKYNF